MEPTYTNVINDAKRVLDAHGIPHGERPANYQPKTFLRGRIQDPECFPPEPVHDSRFDGCSDMDSVVRRAREIFESQGIPCSTERPIEHSRPTPVLSVRVHPGSGETKIRTLQEAIDFADNYGPHY